MNEKKAKKLRKEALITLASSPKKDSARTNGPTAYLKPMLANGEKLGASFKQIKRAVRFAVDKLERKLPNWAMRLQHNRYRGQYGRLLQVQ